MSGSQGGSAAFIHSLSGPFTENQCWRIMSAPAWQHTLYRLATENSVIYTDSTINPKRMTHFNIPPLHDLRCGSVKWSGTFGTSKGQNRCPSVTKWATGRQLGSQITNAGTNVLAALFVCLFICMFVYFSLWIPQVWLTEAIFRLVRFNVFLCLSAVRQMLIYIHLICKCDSLRSVTAWFIFHVFARMFGYFLR